MQILPVHLNLFAFFILLGVAQVIFLGLFFLIGKRGGAQLTVVWAG